LLISNAIDEAREVARALRLLRPQLIEVSVEDYDNRILVGAPRSASGRMLRASVAAHPLLSSAVERLRFRTLPRRSGRRSSA
jgi:hypothetical protein